ncbi:proprotein convertase P-domain-containing protein [Flavilitoribacter nigricans]|uniref:T9SS type A sorting domain-containing protein n=1 Tax=Flavilitoribacter nigricans (strain ATCC 23147 / DSM 23189 / NBRC 102662 / NCIMB 1420 / SS-2) TaxID=1122177 RepID=A0A2D0N762_FLAN2|nr:proprotein convertase P-domain-containing protein [Flavilitoribacter nigricans]PHN04226.1 hypothetical protein CRP01_21945 [Flavilitoribacter nigricans DSM 23189 = NBRC 102662]
MTISFRRSLAFISSIFAWLLISPVLSAQHPTSAILALPADQVEPYVLPTQDNQALLDEEMERRQSGQPPRFATPIPLRITPAQHGRWDVLGDLAIWRFRIQSPGAHSLNLGFTQYQMPAGGKLYLYDPVRNERRGPFTPADNESHNQLWTPVLPGDDLIIEIRVPVARKNKLAIELAVVNHDFLGFGKLSSGSCNLDIVCGQADGWGIVDPYRDVARSVGLYSVQGTLLCTGFLVNNTQQDCTPYFLTANHCEVSSGNAASIVVYWNFENSTCRQPNSFESGQNGDGKLNDFNTGSIFRSSWSNSDFCLIELDDPVSETANAYFAGWSAEDVLPTGKVISVHHPFTDEKRISFSEETTHLGFWGSSDQVENGNHLIVNSWTTGTTQSGSSGGPLFNERGQAIGQLHGGDAACGNSSYDAFGRLFNSWEGGGTPDSRLKDWLDPIGLGRLSVEGKEQGRCSFSVIGTFAAGNICVGDNDTLLLQYGEAYTMPPEFRIGDITPDLDITLESIPSDENGSARFVWFTGAGTPAGQQTFPIYTTYEEQTDTSYVFLNILAEAPEIPILIQPTDMAVAPGLKIGLSWNAIAIAERYYLQVSTDPDFGTLLTEQVIEETSQIVISDLQPNSAYFWRVAAENTCGLSAWSDTNSFLTADVRCGMENATDSPIVISSTSANTISSEMELDISGTVASIEVTNVNIQHDWVGDLSLVLRSPSGTEVALVDRPGFPASLFGCDGTGLYLSFNEDVGASHQSLETTCSSGQPAISGTYKPLESLASLIGETARGTWTLVVKDQADEDGGTLVGWQLDICTIPEPVPLISGVPESYVTCFADSLQLELVVSEAFSGQEVTLGLNSDLPDPAISFSKNPANPGDTINFLLRNFPASGSYDLELTASDGATTGSFPFSLEIRNIPSVAVLGSPLDGSSVSTTSTTFSWNANDANSYRLDIASDMTFTELVRSVEVASNFYTLELPEQDGIFFWRVIATNDCGESTSTVSSFMFSTSATSDLQDGRQVRIYPNPFGSTVFLEFSAAPEVRVPIRILDTSGRLLYSSEIQAGNLQKQLHLERLSPGVYLLELTYRGQRYLQRLIKSR